MVKDPVCGLSIDERQARATSEHEGRVYYFCSPSCQQIFAQDPERHARGSWLGGDDLKK